ncbi:MAG: sugar ABC transporter ATP-binding protein [Chloroflexi bacterium]|nr:sugar ABC transporter ATP-binding protein [Chloroflexota bacterium]
MPDEPVAAPAAHLECRGITKTFGGTVALDGVSLAIRAGSVHAFVGENGAGKSTLGKILAGVHAPDSGMLLLRGRPVGFGSPREALSEGIAIVAQELALVPRMTVAENVFLGVEPQRRGFVDRGEIARRFRALAADAGFDLPADAPVGRLPIARQQQVEILRALAREASLIVLDEPTAALSGPDAERLHEIVRGLAAAGRTVALVSHFLGEVLGLADTVTILRDGRVVRSGPTAAESEATLISGMLGRTIERTYPARRPPPADAPVVLRVAGLSAPGVRDVSLEVRAGEIVALAGLIGAGRSELARAIFGAAPRTAGSVELGGADDATPRRWRSPAEALAAGLAFLPESRADDGLLLRRPVRENVSLASLPRLSRFGIVPRGEERRRVRGVLEETDVRGHAEQPVATLSGGNQQKVLFARMLLAGPRLLIADEPTRGVDVGAKRQIYDLLAELAADGLGVLFVSSELEEVLGMAHRVLVMRGGRVSAELRGDEMTEAAILEAAFAATGHAA